MLTEVDEKFENRLITLKNNSEEFDSKENKLNEGGKKGSVRFRLNSDKNIF